VSGSNHQRLSIFFVGFVIYLFPDHISILEIILIIFIEHQLETIFEKMSLVAFVSHSGARFQVRIFIDLIWSGLFNNAASEGSQWLSVL